MPFDVYYPISEVASRLGTSARTVKRMAERGEFGKVWRIAGELRVGEVGLLSFLDRHEEDFSDVARELRRQAFERQLGRPLVPERGPFSAGVSARCEGELRRKLQAVQTSEREEANA